jgi:hypothetical protein
MLKRMLRALCVLRYLHPNYARIFCCFWCGSERGPMEPSYGMTRPGYCGWRNTCPACAAKRQRPIIPPRGGSGLCNPTRPAQAVLRSDAQCAGSQNPVNFSILPSWGNR